MCFGKCTSILTTCTDSNFQYRTEFGFFFLWEFERTRDMRNMIDYLNSSRCVVSLLCARKLSLKHKSNICKSIGCSISASTTLEFPPISPLSYTHLIHCALLGERDAGFRIFLPQDVCGTLPYFLCVGVSAGESLPLYILTTSAASRTSRGLLLLASSP